MRAQVVALCQLLALLLYSLFFFIQVIRHNAYLWLLFFPIALVTIMFPVNYLVNNLINLFYRYKPENSKYYFCVPVRYLHDESYPDLSIVIPVYKEDFDTVILPTLESAIRARGAYRGTCNIIVLDDGYQFQDKKLQVKKLVYYNVATIGMIARPKTGRTGRFKKASNLNNHIKICQTGEQGDSVVVGNIQLGKYFILIDSDSRIDHDKVNDAVSTIDHNDRIGYIQFHTKPLSNSYGNVFSRQIALFTKNLYDLVFVIVTVGGEPAPLVGHNAIIRSQTLIDSRINDGLYWSESKVSEDFDFSFRANTIGYHGVYATFATYQEGISFDLHSELLKMSKFSYGSIEILLSTAYRQFMISGNAPWTAKVNITSYLFSYIALALAPLLSLLLLLFSCIIEDLYKITPDPVILMCISFAIFSILGPISTYLCLRRIQEPESVSFKQQLILGLFMFLFYSGSMYWFMAGILFMRQWGSTKKEHGKVQVAVTYWKHYLFTAVYILAMTLILTLMCANWYGAIPCILIAACHLVIPVLWRGSTDHESHQISFIV